MQRLTGDRPERRVFRFDTTFASRHAAQVFAVTQVWLHTALAPSPTC